MLLVVLAGCGVLVAAQAEEFTATLREIEPVPLVLSGAFGLLGTFLTGVVWLVLLDGLGVRADRAAALRVYYVTQLGKYVPGSIWPAMAQMEFGRRWGAARRTMLAATILLISLVALTGFAVGVLILPRHRDVGWGAEVWTLALLPALVVCLHPRVVPWLLDRALGLLGRPPVRVMLTWRALLSATAWALVGWVALGLHLHMLVASVGRPGVSGVSMSVGVMAFAWAAGLVVVLAPAGAGVREGLLVALLTGPLGVGPALAVAVASRVLLVLADVVLAVVARPRRVFSAGLA